MWFIIDICQYIVGAQEKSVTYSECVCNFGETDITGSNNFFEMRNWDHSLCNSNLNSNVKNVK